jgi:hypothetical protein
MSLSTHTYTLYSIDTHSIDTHISPFWFRLFSCHLVFIHHGTALSTSYILRQTKSSNIQISRDSCTASSGLLIPVGYNPYPPTRACYPGYPYPWPGIGRYTVWAWDGPVSIFREKTHRTSTRLPVCTRTRTRTRLPVTRQKFQNSKNSPSKLVNPPGPVKLLFFPFFL